MSRRHRGMFMMDALFGTMIAVIVTTCVIVAVSMQQRGSARLAETRSRARHLESAVIQLQEGESAPADVQIRAVAAAAPIGWTWVEVSEQNQSLRGLVPRGAVK